jgi:hypothetical protein
MGACSKNGIMNVQEHYTWASHAARYAREVNPHDAFGAPATDMARAVPRDAIGRRLASVSTPFTDIDNTLIGEDNSQLATL